LTSFNIFANGNKENETTLVLPNELIDMNLELGSKVDKKLLKTFKYDDSDELYYYYINNEYFDEVNIKIKNRQITDVYLIGRQKLFDDNDTYKPNVILSILEDFYGKEYTSNLFTTYGSFGNERIITIETNIIHQWNCNNYIIKYHYLPYYEYIKLKEINEINLIFQCNVLFSINK
jgi:hypothetical protein